MQCLIHNAKFPTKHAELDFYWDKKSWATESYGEAGDGLTGKISNKPVITKAGQTVLVSDVQCTRPRAYRHRHKFHVKTPGWNVWGNIKFKETMEVTNMMVDEEGGG